MLKCPVCEKELKKVNRTYKCEKNHSFDIAKQGYTNLFMKSSKHSGDGKEMVEARTTFLNQNHYEPLLNTLIDILSKLKPSVIIDAGCGEGYYTNKIQEALNCEVYGFDLSKDALKYASRTNKNVHYFLSNIYDIPMMDASCDVILNIFAPLSNKEYMRLVKEGGYLIKVDPHHKHLKEMKDFLYDEVYENEVLDLDVEGFTLMDYKEVTYKMSLDNTSISSLFKMTPYYYKTKIEKGNELMKLQHLDCTASFIIYIYKKNDIK